MKSNRTLFLLTLTTGCVDLDDSDPASESIVESEVLQPGVQLWPRIGTGPAVLNICFADQAYDEDGFESVPGFDPLPGEGLGYKDWIIDGFTESWGRVANIQINIYDNCPSANPPAGWVVVYFNDNNHAEQVADHEGNGLLGYNPNGHNKIWLNHNEGQGMPPADFDHHLCGWEDVQPRPINDPNDTFDTIEKLRTDAMHELGHTLGLSHNQLDPDSPTEPGTGTLCTRTSVSGDQNPGDFDYGSVMDYCTQVCNPDHWGQTRPFFKMRLSDWDVMNIQTMYGTKYTANRQFFVGHRNTAIEVPGSNFVAGQQLQVWDWKGGVNEQWVAANSTHINLRGSNLVWDVRGATTSPYVGTPIQLYPSLNQTNQLFKMKAVEWRGAGDNCLTAKYLTTGSTVELQRCNGSRNQNWDVTYGITSTQFKLTGTSLCVASPSTSPTDGLDLKLESCIQSGSRSVFISQTGGQVGFGGKCMDTETGKPTGAVISTGSDATPRSLDTYDIDFVPTRRGLTLQLYTCKSAAAGNLNQQFHLRGPITGLDNQCVDIAGGVGKRGANVQLFPCTGNPNQVWDMYIL